MLPTGAGPHNLRVDALAPQPLQSAGSCFSLKIASGRLTKLMRTLHVRLAFFFVLLCSVWAGAQQRPLLTEDVDIIPPGSVRIEAGVDFVQNAKFPVSGLTGDLTRVGVIGINIGLAPNVEFQIDGVLQNFLSVNTATVPSP